MVTRLAQVLIPDVWFPYMIQRTAEKSSLWSSGILVQNAETDALARGGGSIINLPYFNDLTGDDEVLSDTAALTPAAITTGRQQGVKHVRGRVFGVNELASSFSGADPMGAIADLVAAYWDRRMQATLVSTLRGLFAAASMATHVRDISVAGVGDAPGDANRISANATIDAFDLLGDETDALTAMMMHSTIYNRLLRQDLIQFEAISEQGQPIRTYLGRRVIVNDNCPRIPYASGANVRFHTYLFGNGSVVYGEGQPETPVETDRDSLRGEDYLINRRHFLLHPQGTRWIGTAAGLSPTNAELQTGTNWQRVFDVKNVKVVALITNG